ncbi:sensor histidine kinase [Lutimonas sp.]|uniref:sensor histidine kinase n=1 Tax=Lutimonas sp. TaxID=1872403 RepID=UPI003D9B7816
MKLTLLQKQALRTAFASLISLIIFAALFWIMKDSGWVFISMLFLGYFITLFFIFIYGTKRFIESQLEGVYKSTLFDNEPSLKADLEDVDFENFTKRIKNFAENKLGEIEQLHNRDDFRRDFIGDVSHELKTPLFTAQGYLLTVLDDSIEDPELEKKYLERANKSIERLSYIVKDLDMIAKLESGMKLDQSEFNIVATINDVFELMEIRAHKKNITLGFKEPHNYPILVRADKEKIEQVIINLLSNSIKYGNINGSTLLQVRTHSVHQVVVDVIDNGVGIDKNNQARLFERFYRVDKSRSRDQGGSGLGLAIVKHIMEAHEQEVLVESDPGKGSTFSFTLNKASS